MVTFTQGQQLGPSNLSILVRDASGALVDPVLINYTIFHVTDQLPLKITQAYEYDLHQPQNMQGGPPLPNVDVQLVGPPQQVPTRSSQGAYYVPIFIPTTWRGVYRLVWNIQMFPTNPIDTVLEVFVVQGIDPANPGFEAPSVIIATPSSISSIGAATPAMIAKAVMYVRELLSDTNPDRNYHFRPPTPGRVVAGYNTRVGYIWLDASILMMLDMSISMLNVYNPMNLYNWTLDNIPVDWGRIAALGAAGLCLKMEGNRWAADQFSYSLNGVTLDVNKSDLYGGLGETYMQQFNTMAPLVTANRPFSAGLRQQRWLLG
jgi:hypothetical protein